MSGGLGWGTAGPTLFFVEAYQSTGNDEWLEPARSGALWMDDHLQECADRTAGCGLFTGVGGWVVVLDELAEATGDEAFRDQARKVLTSMASRASASGSGVHWHGLTEVLWGTAGIGCLMIDRGQKYLGAQAIDLAQRAGDWLLTQAESTAGGGARWSLGPAWEAEHPSDHRRFPNFAHGAAGIGFFLAKLTQSTGERRFLDGAFAAFEWIRTTLRSGDEECAAYHHEPDGTGLFTLGWCHGPPGLGWFVRQMEITTGDVQWRQWLRRTARSVRTSGIPERREPGFWDNVARCCGSAGVAEFFLDLHALEGREDDLQFAKTLVDDLLGRAIQDDVGIRWSNYEFRDEQPHLPAETTYLQGAAGIGSTVLRLNRHLAGDRWTVRWPHAPTWFA